jgi:pre-mRNA-processing factor 8
LFSGFGYSFSNLKHHLLTGLKKLMKNNSALYILRDRIRKGLQLYSGKCLDSIINKEDYFEMFKSGISWLIDDSLFYRVSVQQSQAGNIKTKPINGVMHIFLPKNGNLLLRIIDSKIWKQQKRLTQLARWKAA